MNIELDAVIRQAVRAGVANKNPSIGLRRQLIERAREQHRPAQPQQRWLTIAAWLDSLLSFPSTWEYQPQYSPLAIDNYYLIGTYRINWRWFM